MSRPSTAALPSTLTELPASHERLALMYEGILTAIVRIQSGRQQLQSPDAFRQRIKDALRDIGEAASQRGYARQLVQEASFAVVAFLDEVVLSSQGGGQSQWARKNLQEELFDQRSAGELFFRHLEDLRTHEDSTQLAEVLEVYYLCLLLGYEGRYASGSKAELHIMMDNVREKIGRVFGLQAHFSPDWMPSDPALPAAAPDPLPQRLRLAAAGAALLAMLSFFTFSCNLHMRTNQLDHLARQSAVR